MKLTEEEKHKNTWIVLQSTFGYGRGCLGKIHFQMNVSFQSRTFESLGY